MNALILLAATWPALVAAVVLLHEAAARRQLPAGGFNAVGAIR